MSFEASSAFALGTMLGQIAVVVGPIAIGFVYANHLNREKSYEDKVKWPIATGFVFTILMLAGQCSSSDRLSHGAEPDPWINVQSAAPAEPWPSIEEIDPDITLKTFSEPLVSEIDEELRAQGTVLKPEDFVTTGQIINNEGLPLVRISIVARDAMQAEYFVGIVDDMQVVVACGQNGNTFDLVASGCAERVAETFGIDVSKESTNG